MIGLKTYRDEAREIQNFFFPLMQQRCEMKIREAIQAKDKDGMLVWRMVLCLFLQVKMKYDKKLLTVQNSFTIKLTEAEAICWYELLMAFPIADDLVYDNNMRNGITDFLHIELKL